MTTTKKASSKKKTVVSGRKASVAIDKVIDKAEKATLKPKVAVEPARIIYIRDVKRVPIGCLSYKIERRNRSVRVLYGVSTHNPADKFNRARGRDIAVSRMTTDPKKCTIKGLDLDDDSSTISLNDILDFVYESLLEDETVPQRLKRVLANT